MEHLTILEADAAADQPSERKHLGEKSPKQGNLIKLLELVGHFCNGRSRSVLL